MSAFWIIIMIICFLVMIFLPLHPILTAICAILGILVPIIIGITTGGTFAFSAEWWMWIIIVVLTICGYLTIIATSAQEVWETSTDDSGATYFVYSGLNFVAYVIASYGTVLIVNAITLFFV